MNRFKELKVWQESMNVVMEVYKLVASFPNDEKFNLTSQIKRSAVSIPSNIAEGAGRKHPKEFAQFLGIASGSAAELITQIEIATRLNLISENSGNELGQKLIHITNMIYKLENWVLDPSRSKNIVSEPNEYYNNPT